MAKQIDIGENTNLVLDVLNFLTSGNLLNPSGKAYLSNGFIDDLETAKSFAWEKFYGEDDYTWSDLRSEKMSEIWDVIYAEKEKYVEVDNQISSLLDEISRVVQVQLDHQHKDLLDDIVSDIQSCLYSRAVFGKENFFFEQILFVYLNGGWPCGWKGNWPDGKLIGYFKTE
ncbi:hypothetical protein [Chitinimonas sp. BJB300]|uniref:hypothetical protein n=1 Tax=Chitinimonas sp. BJB300 TaxID=1559339 RepID=UPI0018EB8590|nr:hypothetical protein [Chitinimonas sp. BJB300]